MNNDTFLHNAPKAYDDSVKALEKAGCRWWCAAGTMLGIMREKGFIGHDSDIDFELMAPFGPEILRKVLESDGWTKAGEFGTPDNGFEFAYRKHGVKCDFFWMYPDEEAGIARHSAWKGKEQLFYEYPLGIFRDLMRIPFCGSYAMVPLEYDKYLTAKYGDWRVPVKEWDWAESPLNRVR